MSPIEVGRQVVMVSATVTAELRVPVGLIVDRIMVDRSEFVAHLVAHDGAYLLSVSLRRVLRLVVNLPEPIGFGANSST